MSKLERIEQLAKAATPGPWGYDDGNVLMNLPNEHWLGYPEDLRGNKFHGHSVGFSSFPTQYSCHCGSHDSDKDSEYIAAVDPQTVLKLVAIARLAREAEQRAFALPSESVHIDYEVPGNTIERLRAALEALDE